MIMSVIASWPARAHQTLRFEAFEQKSVLPITDQDVLNEYKAEGGVGNSGLVVLDSLKAWRNSGWDVTTQIKTRKSLCRTTTVATQQKYTIYAFAAVDWHKLDEVAAGMYLLRGLGGGLALPRTAYNQDVWDYVPNDPGNAPASWGYHYIYYKMKTPELLTCVTWGGYKDVTWKFFEEYTDELWAIVDNKDSFLSDSPVDIKKLNGYLMEVTA